MMLHLFVNMLLCVASFGAGYAFKAWLDEKSKQNRDWYVACLTHEYVVGSDMSFEDAKARALYVAENKPEKDMKI